MEMINTTESYRVMAETFLHSTVQSKPYISLKQDRATKQTVRAAIELLKQTFIHRIISRYYRKYRLSPFDDSTSAGDIETGEGSQGRRDVASKQKGCPPTFTKREDFIERVLLSELKNRDYLRCIIFHH